MESPLKKIVLVEDEGVIMNLLNVRLTQEGYDVICAKDGVSGLELIRESKPDLVLLDMKLPRMNGSEVLEKLSEEKLLPELPVILISNSGQPVELERALALGVKDYLVKVNFDLEEIVLKINYHFQSNGAKGSVAPGTNSQEILLVEDEMLLVHLLEKKFQTSGFHVTHAMDLDQARTVMKDRKIDLILLDLMLPGANGLTLLLELKQNERLKSIPVIIISNFGQYEKKEESRVAGAVDYIVKADVSPEEIVSRVKKVLKAV